MLSPQTLAKDIEITDDDLRAAYDQHKAEYIKPEKRSAEVISAPDEAKAAAARGRMAGRRRLGADAEGRAGRRRIGDRAGRRHRAEFPDRRTWRAAVFAAAPDAVCDPANGALGWHVVRVTKVTPGSERSFDAGEGRTARPGAGRARPPT